MPEGPEIKRTTEFLNKCLKNQKITEFTFQNKQPKDWDFIDKLFPLELEKVYCKGKFIWFVFKDTDITFWSTLGLNGHYYLEEKKHTRFCITTDKCTIYYDDKINFGSQKIGKTKEEFDKKIKTLGLDILDIDNTPEEYLQLLRSKTKKTNHEIGKILMNQKYTAGCGNYIRADTLYLSKIDPFKKINDITDEDIKFIWFCLQKIAFYNYNIKKKFYNKILLPQELSTIKNFKIYKKKKDINGNDIITKKLDGRTVHYCPAIQK